MCVAAVMLFAAMACGRGTPQSENVVRSDSAGVKIITSSGPDTELAWRFDTLGLLTDSLGDPWLFTGLSPRFVLTDRAGRTYVLESEPAIRRFGRDGRYERSFGRKGGAPGEMQFAYQLLQQGDSVAVLDAGRNAIVRWGPDLEPIADLPRRGALDRVQSLAFRSGGAWVENSTFDSTGSRTMLYLDTLGSAPVFEVNDGRPKMMQACGGRLGFAMNAFFSPRIIWASSGARMLATLGPDYRLQLYEGSRLIASVRRDIPQRAPTVADLRRLYPDGLKFRTGGFDCTVPLDELMQNVGFAPVMLEVHGIALLSDATMWVQRSVNNEKPPVLDVFGSDGSYAGSVRGFYLPVGLLPNGEVLIPLDDEDSGGLVIARMRIRK